LIGETAHAVSPKPGSSTASSAELSRPRPARRRRRRYPGEAGVWRAKLAAGRGRESSALLLLHAHCVTGDEKAELFHRRSSCILCRFSGNLLLKFFTFAQNKRKEN
jgi:hypothetical protein